MRSALRAPGEMLCVRMVRVRPGGSFVCWWVFQSAALSCSSRPAIRSGSSGRGAPLGDAGDDVTLMEQVAEAFDADGGLQAAHARTVRGL